MHLLFSTRTHTNTHTHTHTASLGNNKIENKTQDEPKERRYSSHYLYNLYIFALRIQFVVIFRYLPTSRPISSLFIQFVAVLPALCNSHLNRLHLVAARREGVGKGGAGWRISLTSGWGLGLNAYGVMQRQRESEREGGREGGRCDGPGGGLVEAGGIVCLA